MRNIKVDIDDLMDMMCDACNREACNGNERHKEFTKCATIRAIEEIADEIGEDDKYRWHDLRKNPDDLPDSELDKVIFKIDRSKLQNPSESEDEYYSGRFIGLHDESWLFQNDDYESYVTYGLYSHSVIAWKYIEPFEDNVNGSE